MHERFDRQMLLFGEEGQRRLREVHVAIVGIGGLGTHVVQQLALLGVGRLSLIDHEQLSASNCNRYIGAWESDLVPGSLKVELALRLVKLIDSSIEVAPVPHSLRTAPAFDAVREAGFVFGCLDHDGARFVLNELCAAYEKPLLDLASDVPEPGTYGGRVCVAWPGEGCMVCLGRLDMNDVRRYLSGGEARENEGAVYGIDREVLGETGPAVVSVNGVVASLGVTEFMCACTGLRDPFRLLEYRGHEGRVRHSVDEPKADCYYCTEVYGKGRGADVERYIER